MLIDSLQKLRLLDFNINIVDVHALNCPKGAIVDNSVNGRRYYLLHLITEGSREYIVGEEKFKCDENTIIFIPEKTKYFSRNQDECSGIGICFTLEGDFQMVEKVYLSSDKTGEFRKKLFDLRNSYKINRLDILGHKAIMYKLLNIATRRKNENSQLSLIEPAIRLLNDTFKQNLPISLYAKKCNLSDSYFRKVFKSQTGTTLIEYRNKLRFDLAVQLKAKGLTNEQISDECGFCNVSYMNRVFKAEIGKSINRVDYSDIL